MAKRKLIAFLLFIIGLGLVILSFWPEANKKISSESSIKSEIKMTSATTISSPTPTLAPLIQAKTLSPTSTPQPTSAPVVLPTATPSPTPTPTPATQTIQVNLSINSGESFTVKADQGDNQCDVLSKALEQGKISSLNMRYDQNLGSNAVYQINGIGKENSVWWTYTINGTPPNQGCSYVKANNSDKIEWKYLGR